MQSTVNVAQDTRDLWTYLIHQDNVICKTKHLRVALQALSPSSALAKTASTYSQSRDLEAEMQQLIQSRQAPLPEAEKKSTVSHCNGLTPFHQANLVLDST